MPSGITHMLLAKTFNEESKHGNADLDFLLDEKLKLFQLGALAPDLAYSQQLPTRDLLNNDDENADLFHYKKTNLIPIRALNSLRGVSNQDDKDNKFAFFLGYASHVVADGIVHPFVRDKVGNYEVAQGAHRGLEMRLDAIFLNFLSSKKGTGVDLNFAHLQKQIKDVPKEDLDSISMLFVNLIQEIYNRSVNPSRVTDWVDDLCDLFEVAANANNCYYAALPGVSSYLYNDTAKVISNQESDLVLRNSEAKGRTECFARRDVHFLNDCVPLFHKKFRKIALAAHSCVYGSGPDLSDAVLPAINLDTGRLLAASDGKDLNQPAIFWEAT